MDLHGVDDTWCVRCCGKEQLFSENEVGKRTETYVSQIQTIAPWGPQALPLHKVAIALYMYANRWCWHASHNNAAFQPKSQRTFFEGARYIWLQAWDSWVPQDIGAAPDSRNSSGFCTLKSYSRRRTKGCRGSRHDQVRLGCIGCDRAQSGRDWAWSGEQVASEWSYL